MAKARRKSAVAKALLGAQAEGVPFHLPTAKQPTAENAAQVYWDTLPGRVFYNLMRADGLSLLNMLRDLVNPKTGKLANSTLGVRSEKTNIGDVVLAATNAVRLRQIPAHILPQILNGDRQTVVRLFTPHGVFDVVFWLDVRSTRTGEEKVSVRFRLALPPTQ